MFSEFQEVLYFPIRKTKAVDAVGATVYHLPAGKYLTGECVYLAAFMHVRFCTFTGSQKSPSAHSWLYPDLETVVTPEQSGEMISQLLTDLLPSLEAALGGP